MSPTAAETRRMRVQETIQETGLPVAMVARLAGVNQATIWSWLRPKDSEAARVPSPVSVKKLSAGLDAYAGKLQELAEELRRGRRPRNYADMSLSELLSLVGTYLEGETLKQARDRLPPDLVRALLERASEEDQPPGGHFQGDDAEEWLWEIGPQTLPMILLKAKSTTAVASAAVVSPGEDDAESEVLFGYRFADGSAFLVRGFTILSVSPAGNIGGLGERARVIDWI